MNKKHIMKFTDFSEAEQYWQQWMTLNRYRDVEDAQSRL